MRQLIWLTVLVLTACSEQVPEQAETSPAAVPHTPVASAATAAFDVGTVKVLPPTQLPAGLPSVPGRVLEARQWLDVNGPNVLLVSRTPVRTVAAGPDDPNDTHSVSLYARQYVQRAGKWEELWHLQDAVEQCPFDTWLGPVPGSVAVTDLDADGRTETTLLYKLVCRSDVSPASLKLIMREGPAKYALRGHTVVQYDSVPAARRIPVNACCLDTIRPARLEEHYELLDGRYESEKDFRQAPPAFLRFARRHWRQWVVEQSFEQL